MEHLARAGVPCPRPVRAREGRACARLKGKPARHRHLPRGPLAAPRHGAALRGAGRGAGASCTCRPGLRADARQRPLVRRLAAALRGLPRQGAERRSRASRPRSRPSWTTSRRPGRPACRAGVIHADLFPDNVFFEGDKVTGVIDFYFACDDLLAYDLAICLNAWCFESDLSFNITKAKALLEGYRRRRPLSRRSCDALPILRPRRGAALPDDAALRLAAPGRGRAGQAQGPAASTCASSASTAASRGSRPMASPEPDDGVVVEIHTDGACSGNPGPGGWARDPALAGPRARALGRGAAHHQQPHGADGGDRGAGGAEAAGAASSSTPTASTCGRASPSGCAAGRRAAG